MEISEKIEELEKILNELSDKKSKEENILIKHNNIIRKHVTFRRRYLNEMKRICTTIEILKHGVKEELLVGE